MKKQRKTGQSFWITVITLFVLFAATVIVVFFAKKAPKESDCKHKYIHLLTTAEASEFEVGENKMRCEKCGNEITQRILATVDMPQLYLDGLLDGISKNSDCIMQAKYIDKESSVEAYASIKYQGHTSILFEKKNYTIKFYEDESRITKKEIPINGWSPTHKFCLKANYIDFSGANFTYDTFVSKVAPFRDII